MTANICIHDCPDCKICVGEVDSYFDTCKEKIPSAISKNYSVRAYCARTLAHKDKFVTRYSEPQTSQVSYPDPDYYRLYIAGATLDYNPNYEQYVLQFPPRLSYDSHDGWGARDVGDAEKRGAVDRFEIYDQYGNLVSQDGTVKEPGVYTVVVYEIFNDVFTNQTVAVKSNTTTARIVRKLSASLSTGVTSATDTKEFSTTVSGNVTSTVMTASAAADTAVADAAEVSAVKVENSEPSKAVLKFSEVEDATG